MDHHPLLTELLQLCGKHDVDPARAYATFEVYQELSEVRKLTDLKYNFSTELKLFYLSGKRETIDEISNIYVPIRFHDEITPQEISYMQQILSPNHKQFYLFIQGADSSSACYSITNGLVKPDSPETCKRKKEIEGKKYQFEKSIDKNRKLFYMKAKSNNKVQERETEEANPFTYEYSGSSGSSENPA